MINNGLKNNRDEKSSPLCHFIGNGNSHRDEFRNSDTQDPKEEEQHCYNWKEETKLLVWDLALPQALLQLGLIFSSALTASYVGRTMEPLYLDGFTLGNLTGNMFVSSLLQGLFSANDTLGPQAFGAGNHQELGLLAIRGTVASFVLLFPIILLLWGYLEAIFVQIHQDPRVARLAADWFRIFSLGFPAYSTNMMMWKFLSAQNIMFPQVAVGVVANFIVLPLCLEVCTKWLGLGFLGTAVANSVYSTLNALLLLAYLWCFQPHSSRSWSGLRWAEALEWKPLLNYLRLGLGGMLCFVEWIYWEIIVLMVGMLGVVPLSVQTIATMVVEVCVMLPTGLGIALSIRIGVTLSKNVRGAQLLSLWSLLIGTVVFGVLSVLLYTQQNLVVALFTRDPNVVEGCKTIWFKVCILHFNVGIYCIVVGIATGLGMQWTLGICNFFAFMIIGLPTVYYYAIFRDGGLDMIWTWINPPYVLISGILIFCFIRTNWRAIANAVIQREQRDNFVVTTNEVLDLLKKSKHHGNDNLFDKVERNKA